MRIKKSIVCSKIDNFSINETIVKTYTPQAGDVGLFEILEIGKHITIQSDSKRSVFLVEGDLILAAFANRYATEQFEGYVPDKPTEIVDILAGGGAIGLVKTKNAALEHIEPTKIKLVGYAVDGTGTVLNTINYHMKRIPFTGHIPNHAKVILSVGSTMDSGKTTSAAYLARGLKTTGKKVAYIKLTGTCHTKDKDMVYDCGADVTLDFSDAGFPSTYMCDKQELLDLYQTLLFQLEEHQPDYIVMEIADGIVQRETLFLLQDKHFMRTIYNLIFSSGDSLSAFYGIQMLGDLGITPAIISGKLTMSPLLINEVKTKTKIPVLDIDELMCGENMKYIMTQGLITNHAH